MHKTQAKIQSMSTAEWHQYHQLLESRRLMDYFSEEILRFTHSQLKPDDVLRRFSLNGDGQLDLKEFQLAVKRLGIIQPATTGYEATQSTNDNDITRATNKKAKELFSVFCPSQNKKMDIDMFCRIMTEWSLTLLKRQQPQSTSSSSPAQQPQQHQQSMASIPTPYAIENDAHSSGGSDPGSSHSHVVHSEGEMIWRRIRDAVVQHLDKLSQIYFKLDISSSGSVSQDEFELAMSHIGVFLTAREYEKLYEALPSELKYFPPNDSNFSVKYADFLAVIQQNHPPANKHILQTSAQTSSPPIATNARLWDLLVQALDKLEPLIQQYERAQQRYVSAETFRDLVLRCGIALSNPDYAAMRVRLLPFTDSTGLLGLSALLHALKAHDRTSMATSVRNSTTVEASGLPTVSPIRTGRKTVFPSVNEQLLNSSSSPSSSPSFYQNGSSSLVATSHAAATHAAGKSNEQRNQEANRAVVKIRDDSRWKSELPFPTNNGYDHHHQQPVAVTTSTQRNHPSNLEDTDSNATGTLAPLALERRILTKLQQLKEVGQIGSSSPQTVFPGDRFGRITRGTFRQSLVHLGVLARYAEVESLFWTLDPNGRGYIVTQDLYDHLNTTATSTTGNWSLPSLSISEASGSPTTGPRGGPSSLSLGRLPRSVQKIFEGMLLHLPAFLQICQRCDPHRTGLITRGELTAAIQELGVLASPQDVQTAITALTQRVELRGASPAATDTATATAGFLPPAEPYHANGIVYSKIEDRLKQLCSDLLSPKKRRQHLSTASVLLAPQENQAFASVSGSLGDSDFNMNIANETDALWNCPRRKQNHDHRAMKSSIQITDRVYDGSPRHATSSQNDDCPGDGGSAATSSDQSRYTMDKHRQLHRGRRLAVISILQDLLERRSELKSVMDLHRHADIHGQVSTRDLVEIMMASRLSLNFSNAVPAGITARDFVDVLYPQQPQNGSEQPFTVSFLDLLHRISELLSELTRVTPVSGKTVTGLYSNNTYPREVTRRMHTSGGIGGGGGVGGGGVGAVAYSPIQLDPVSPRSRTIGSTTQPGGRTMSLFASDELSLQRKLLYESRLSELLTSEKSRQSAAVLIRHAFKGVMAREMVVPIDNGEFEAVCRASDLKHVCFRLGLDLDAGELHFLVTSLDPNHSGYIASPQLMQFFTHLALRAHSPAGGGAGGGGRGGGGGGGRIYAAPPTVRDELNSSRIGLGY